MLNVLRVFTVVSCSAAIAALLASIPPSPAEYRAIVTTIAGDVYSVGYGATCTGAFDALETPADWRELSCNKTN